MWGCVQAWSILSYSTVSLCYSSFSVSLATGTAPSQGLLMLWGLLMVFVSSAELEVLFQGGSDWARTGAWWGPGRRAVRGKGTTESQQCSAGAASSWPAIACLLHPCQGLIQQQHLCLWSQKETALGRRENVNP